MKLFRIRTQSEYEQHLEQSQEYLAMIQRTEKKLTPSNRSKSFSIRGFSYTAGCEVDFKVGYEHCHSDGSINWREHLNCSKTGFNNRMRATIQLFDSEIAAHKSDRIYISEQITPMYAYFAERYETVVGSEYLGNSCPPGTTDRRGVRNESLTSLSFADGSFERLISLDCLEHFPDYETAFRECARVLTANGKMLWTVPFVPRFSKNLMRARIDSSGKVEHLQPPEYHGDPLTSEGCLCFTHFGWEMLEQIKAAGFADAYAAMFWSESFGYLGGEQLVFFAHK